MAEIRVRSYSDSTDELEGDGSLNGAPRPGAATTGAAAIQMQGFASDDRTPSGSPSTPSSNPFSSGKTGSLRSEPDIDTILPLPGSPPMAGKSNQGYSVVGPLGVTVRGVSGDGWRVDGDEEEKEDGNGQGRPYTDQRHLLREDSDFTTVEHPLLSSGAFGDDPTAKALATCKNTVLKPYFVFLKLIGWRNFRSFYYDLEPPLWLKFLNVLWPTCVCVCILVSCVTQILTCFRRSASSVKPTYNKTLNLTYYDIDCSAHVLTNFIVPQILLFCSFVYGLYIFRGAQTERLATLTEAVFLGSITRQGAYSHRRLTFTLQLMMLLGFMWILFSLGANIFRAFSLHLLGSHTVIEWIPSYADSEERSNLAIRIVLVVISILGFVVLDFAYVAVVINYSFQCQLIIYLLHNISCHMKTKEWDIEHTIKEIKNAREYLSQLNSHLARAVSILLFIFLASCVEAFYELKLVHRDVDFMLDAAAGVLSAIQWTIILALPLIQASRVTGACSHLKKSSLEVRSRPYSYKDTAQLDLDSLVTYTTGLSMSAKLVSIPVYPGLVAGAFFLGGLLLFLFLQYDTYSWAAWL